MEMTMSSVVVLFRAVQEIKMKLFAISFLIFMLCTFISCVSDETENPVNDSTREYFPLTVGKYISYTIDSIVIDDAPAGNTKDTISFQLKEEVSGIQLTNGDTLYYIHRFRKDSTEAWRLTDTWTAR